MPFNGYGQRHRSEPVNSKRLPDTTAAVMRVASVGLHCEHHVNAPSSMLRRDTATPNRLAAF